MQDNVQELLKKYFESEEYLMKELEVTPECPDENTFCRFIEGKLGRKQQKQVREHIVGCPACLADLVDAHELRKEQASRAAAPRRWKVPTWGWWGLGFSSAAVSACTALMLVILAGPALRLEPKIEISTVRSVEQESRDSESWTGTVVDGGVLHQGDQWRVYVSAKKSGYFYIYTWSAGQGGEFVYPSKATQPNYIEKGSEPMKVPPNTTWEVFDTPPGTEYQFPPVFQEAGRSFRPCQDPG